MKIIDISWPVTEEITEYKDRETVKFNHFATYQDRGFEESTLCFGTHTGTHIDAPRHFIEDGKTIDQLPLEKFVGPCLVLNLTHVEEKITKEDLEGYGQTLQNKIILLKTKSSSLEPTAPFNQNFVYLDAAGAEYLASLNVKTVGIDYLGIERGRQGHPTHKALLSKDIPIIEGLRLKDVQAKQYTFTGLPLKLEGLEAAPARCILIED